MNNYSLFIINFITPSLLIITSSFIINYANQGLKQNELLQNRACKLAWLGFFPLRLSISSFLSVFYSSFPNSASSLADRAPPYGGIARPQGSPCMARNAAIRGCSVCPPLIFGKNRIGFAKG
jgi:hypothetical protein